MLIAICQFNPTIGSIKENAKKLLCCANEAFSKNAELLIAPELSICGYPPGDLVFNLDFHRQIDSFLRDFSEKTPLPVLLGAPLFELECSEKHLHNAAVLCYEGKFNIVAKKELLPNYGVFDELRYFKGENCNLQKNIFKLNSVNFAVTICEDAWNDADFWKKQTYPTDPVKNAIENKADVVINISASPFSKNKPKLREKMFSFLARKYKKPFLVCSQVGANDQLVFDGFSAYYDEFGCIKSRLSGFREEIGLINIFDPKYPCKASEIPDELCLLAGALCLSIKDYIEKSSLNGAIVGLSGGLDSSLVVALSVKALSVKNVTGVCMPSKFSSKSSLLDSYKLAYMLGIRVITIPIEKIVDSFRRDVYGLIESAYGKRKDIVDQNIQARARGTVLMTISNQTENVVLCTSNKSELAVGYSTIYGDMCGAFSPIADIYKTDVFSLSSFVGMVANVLKKPPSAELRTNQRDSDTLPEYALMDSVLLCYLEKNMSIEDILKETALLKDDVRLIINMVNRSEHKRKQSAFSASVSSKTFGINYRVPVVKNFNPFD